MNSKKRIACVFGGVAALIFSAAVLADSNGSGNKSNKSKKESAASFCSALPLICDLVGTDNNGSGNEPPKN